MKNKYSDELEKQFRTRSFIKMNENLNTVMVPTKIYNYVGAEYVDDNLVEITEEYVTYKHHKFLRKDMNEDETHFIFTENNHTMYLKKEFWNTL